MDILIDKMKNIMMDGIILFHLLIRKFRMDTNLVNGVDFYNMIDYAIDQNSYECNRSNTDITD